jgi:hypothetical protein
MSSDRTSGGGLVLLGAVLLGVNYLYQGVQIHPDWHAAFERSYFQLLALFCVYLDIRRGRKRNDD